MSTQHKKIAILGAGESGVGSAILAKKRGFDVFVSDEKTIRPKFKEELLDKNISFEENQHTEALILDYKEIIKSPGIPDTTPLITKLKERNISILSEIEFASRYCQAAIIGITGSNGKTTTSLLTYHILKEAGYNVGLAGNIGQSFARQVANCNFDYYVLELSSFQLDNMYEFKADIAVLLNITPDHLDRYDHRMSNYTQSKFRIIQNLKDTDAFIYCADDEEIRNELNKRNIAPRLYPFSVYDKQSQGSYIDNEELIIKINKNRFSMKLESLALQGKHNTYNSMAAGIAGKLLDVRNETLRACLSDFKNVAHRLEYVATIHDIIFINDSKATNVNATWYALESIQAPVIWIVGGADKGNDYTMLKPLVKEKVKTIVCLGVNNNKIHSAFQADMNLIIDAKSAKEAVNIAYHSANKGDVVLLSPACASFDLFKNYEDRGEQFKNAVMDL